MITVSRSMLLESKAALDALGKVYIPVGKGKYWFIKTLSRILSAYKRENKNVSLESNRLIDEFGTVQANTGQKGIQQTELAAMAKYTEGMEKYTQVEVQLDIKKITLTELQEAQVSLIANDQVALMWLLEEK